MKVLFLHSDFLHVKVTRRAIEDAEDIKEKEYNFPESLVCFIAIEENDKDIESCSEEFSRNVEEISNKIGVKRIVLYPYVHLTNKPSDPRTALEIIKRSEEILKEKGFEVYRVPFGWYKEFNIKVKGHPLAELSRVIYPKKKEKKINKIYVILFPNGEDYVILGEDKDKIFVSKWDTKENKEIKKDLFNKEFLALIEKEALGKSFEEHKENPIRDSLKKFGIEWENLSDYGHLRYKPYAALMIDLISDYSIEISKKLDFPVYVIKGTNMFDLKDSAIGEHARLYGERLYEVETDKSKFVLRYAACFQQFSIAKDLVLSYKNLPFGMLEIADSYRFEQRGEVVLGFRMRKFFMPDLHVFCKDIDEAWKYFVYMHNKIMGEIKKIGRDYELLINVGSLEYYNKYKEKILEIAKDMNKPVLVCIYPYEKSPYYWILNIEYHIIDILGRPREIGTTQIDIGNGKRFKIKYTDKDGKEKYVIILHNAIIGSVERYLYALFDTALRKEKPMLPLWISPVQVRIIPVSEKYLEYSLKIAKEFEKNDIRVEVDDRNESVSKKIRDAESLWIPYIIVIGEKEIKSNKLSVRIRETGKVEEKDIEEIISEIKEKVKGYPKRGRYWPLRISINPFI